MLLNIRIYFTLSLILIFSGCKDDNPEEMLRGNFVSLITDDGKVFFSNLDVELEQCYELGPYKVAEETFILGDSANYESFTVQLYKQSIDKEAFDCNFDYTDKRNYRINLTTNYSDSTILIYQAWYDGLNLDISVEREDDKTHITGNFSGLLISPQPYDPVKFIISEPEPFDSLFIEQGVFSLEIN